MEMDVLASITQGRKSTAEEEAAWAKTRGSRENVTRYGKRKQFAPAGTHTWSARPLFSGTAETTEAGPLWPA